MSVRLTDGGGNDRKVGWFCRFSPKISRTISDNRTMVVNAVETAGVDLARVGIDRLTYSQSEMHQSHVCDLAVLHSGTTPYFLLNINNSQEWPIRASQLSKQDSYKQSSSSW